MDLVGTTSSIQSSVSVTCTLGMVIPVTVGTIVPLFCVMTTGGIGDCTSYKNDCEKLFVSECISTSSYYVTTVAFSQELYVMTSSMLNLARLVHHKFCGVTASVRMVLYMDSLPNCSRANSTMNDFV